MTMAAPHPAAATFSPPGGEKETTATSSHLHHSVESEQKTREALPSPRLVGRGPG